MIARCVVVAVLFAAVALGQEVAPAETTPAAAVEATTVEGSGAAAAAVDASAPTTTTLAPLASDAPATNSTKCVAWKMCNSTADCGEGKGNLCLGTFVGKCNCNACINFWSCKDDAACGGLKGACDMKSNTCRCWEALEKNGFPFLKAVSDLCNVAECAADGGASCLGLPCNTGRCVCKA
ncbi:hypothetical protein PRIPAC_75103 [Pristionchus pacificus]|uniref:Uncharacterized protein n=1 Tax=Pristionchus pacificus TaxID=54126 RepID=A0A4X3NDR1_PRIPA|nr:hypothetical protein PRIPAC_75103 [Pristionchus pacificus]|eukprot:PDM74181.1 hypothetical protein PRIPAC_41537 [Pristionchus pacificus]